MASPPARIPNEVQDRINDGAIGPYKILSTIGAGGMGAVFRCRDAKLRREVAVKLLLAPSESTNIERFLSEARTMARLSHPNVVQVYDVGYDGHVPYFVMELVEGDSLATKLERLGRLPVEETLEVTAQIASGLAAVHRLGLIHRDVKAANVIETRDGIAKLLDFGIARPVEKAPQLTSAGLVMGTPSSMAPEQLRGEELDQRADVYALGVLAYQLLTGQRPYEGDDPTDLARQQEAGPYRPVRELRPDASDELVRMIDRALAQKKENRYWNCEEILEDLAPGASHHPGMILQSAMHSVMHSAEHHPSRAPTRRASRRHVAAAGLIACFVALVMLVAFRRWTNGCVLLCDRVDGVEGRPGLEAVPAGIFLWHDGFGWHVRARSVDAARELSGSVRVTGGTLRAVHAISDASADALEIDGRHEVRFRFEDPGPMSGFDFQAGEGCVELGATSKDAPVPSMVHLGADATAPAQLPFRVCR
ncbi:MAG TPA: serine/threonine-protein kinase [bacterium]|nr:serine/threonine-protein kinase [bacterium]